MSHEVLSQHNSYNNRFRTTSSSGDCNDPTSPTNDLPLHQQPQPLHVETGQLDLPVFGQSPLDSSHLTRQSYQGQQRGPGQFDEMFFGDKRGRSDVNYQRVYSHEGHGFPEIHNRERDGDTHNCPQPQVPGKPRRESRTSASSRRQQFADSRYDSGSGNGGCSGEGACDDVFVDVEGATNHSWPSHQRQSRDQINSTSTTTSTANMIPNPYNSFNHCLHSYVWCCNCLQFVFFCCLPAIHYMEQSDAEFRRNNIKKAKTLGTASTLLFFTGTFVTLSVFALVFFLAIFFTIH